MNIFTFKVYGIRGSVASADVGPDGIIVEIQAESLNNAADSIREYLNKSYLKCDKVVLERIEINRLR
jgi:hypothetical protein